MPQVTTISVGAASAEVSLVAQSRKPKEAKHDTRWVDGTPEPNGSSEPWPDESLPPCDGERDDTATDPTETQPPAELAAAPLSAPAGHREHGVWRGQGEARAWVDLTAELAEVDDAFRLDGIRIESTAPESTLEASRVRGASYVVPRTPESRVFLGHLWDGLRTSNSIAVVRFSKRTNEYLGVLRARGSGTKAFVELLEVEWFENAVPLPPTAELSPPIGSAATAAMAALRDPGVLGRLRDERNARRAELLQAAREGRDLPGLPQVLGDPVSGLERALLEVGGGR
jgi:hypothetical protein